MDFRSLVEVFESVVTGPALGVLVDIIPFEEVMVEVEASIGFIITIVGAMIKIQQNIYKSQQRL